MYTGQLVYCGRRATLSIGDARGVILEGAAICNASAEASGDYAIVVSHNPDSDASAGASGDYAIIVSRNLDSDTSARASGDYTIIPSHNPDNGPGEQTEPWRGVVVELGTGVVTVEPGQGAGTAACPEREHRQGASCRSCRGTGRARASSPGRGAGTSAPPPGRSTAPAGHERATA
ncbi:uncharacterized protein [Miscanthus floridulus]|uniref:uncharacterized protein n=1 Tax=Miscanthus floridulus TaxID=154761 RepID=UPI003457C385